MEDRKIPREGVSLRAVLLALVIIPINTYWITVVEVRWHSLDGTCLPLFVTPIFILLLITLTNLLVARLSPRLALDQGELLTIYIMIVIASTLASHDLLQNLFGAIGHAERMATPYNNWRGLWFQYLPRMLLIFDTEALEGLYEGGVNPWQWDILEHWVGPLALWALFISVLVAMMLAVNVLIRKQWTEHDRLAFPLVQLPLAMTARDSKGGIYANKVLWIGFGVPIIIGIINGMHVLYPSLPYIPGVKHYNVGEHLTTPPWSALRVGGSGFQISMYPFTIGLAYFIPSDLSFSCWFFYISRKLWQVFGATRGWDAVPGTFPCYEEQSSGAWIGLGIVVLWGTRKHLAAVWRSAWREEDDPYAEPGESRLYRRAILTIVAGALFLIVFSRYIGLSAWAALVFFGIYFILAIALTRIRAELGTPHEIVFVNPVQVMVSVFGVGALGAANLTVLSSMYWFNRCYRSHPMPNQLEAFKMAEGTSIRLGPLIGAIGIATVAGIIATYWANLQVTYSEGAQAKCLGFKWWVGGESYDKLTNWITSGARPEATRLSYMGVGAAIVLALRGLRGAFISWPFHPAGYALAVSYAMDYFWFAFFVGWLVKLLIVRYGGMKLYNAMVPFFLGLILGDFTIGSIWAIIGPVLGVRAYRIFI